MSHDRDQQDLLDLFGSALRETPPQHTREGGLRQRLLARAAASCTAHAGQKTLRRSGGEWRTLKSGVRARSLHDGANGTSVLIALDPGAVLPPHRHRHLEEGIVLTGSMQMGDLDLGPGDYHVSFPGSRHASITSRDGCLTYLRGSSLGDMVGLIVELFGGLMPGAGEAPVTITTQDGEWRAIADGVEEKRLWHDATRCSRFLRFAPGARLPGTEYGYDTEFIAIFGEVFCGDILLRSHDFHLAPAGTRHAELTSDVGGILFQHGAAD